METEKLAAQINTHIENDRKKHSHDEVSPKHSKGKNDSNFKVVSAEHIAQVRAKRQAERKAKKEAMIARGLDPDCPPDLQFIRRPLLEVDSQCEVKGFKFKLMTYNCLAQALIRRKLFPNSGNALKWFKRSQVLLKEFEYYSADILCLQEIDFIQYQSFWKKNLHGLGYDLQFHRHGTKNHGVTIAWKRELFSMADRMLIEYDKEASDSIEPRTTTNNVGLILALKFSDRVTSRFPGSSSKGILVGTTHLFWHPFGTFERTRQCYVLLKKMKEFSRRVMVLQDGADRQDQKWYPFICGDFNSQPFDAPYLSMTSKPISYEDRAKTVIACSTSYTFSKRRNGEDCDEEEGGNIEKYGDQPATPVPQQFDANQEQLQLLSDMEKIHNALPARAISVYSVGYKSAHPENAGVDNKRHEPEISNWAETWRGLLDYIFFIQTWDFSDKRKPDELGNFRRENGVTIRRLLRMPPACEMPSHGQPHEGEYGSDHLAMMCELELDMH
ncbi:LAMI_0G01200g1_1 [Lachancea mirantina]|uniref:LAMI_0G01200g1_1 n=1 Tax=Lachancea mirantina TaxID=1230905 RepID=A0A1G4K7D1_9SACH|nr:LAMI_0G01200g1_1 [Lachancea mirantina]